MIVYLAGYKTIENIYTDDISNTYILSSFFDYKSSKSLPDYLYQKKHILDSGAFSTFRKIEEAKKIDWKKYALKYIALINETKQDLFFELDIDAVIGLQKVEDLRKLIEDKTGKQPIPVWHSNRGYEYYLKTCSEYKYVAIGTTSAMNEGKIFRKNPELINKFILDAKKEGCKIHGLGFTKTDLLSKLKFDSVDSTTWLGGGKYGCYYLFNNGKILTKQKPKGLLLKDYRKINIFNFNEWAKYQKYAERHL